MILIPMNGAMMPADAIDPEIVPQQRGGTDRAVLDASQGERDQSDDDQRIEDHGRQDRARRARQVHHVERIELRIGGRECRRDDREVLGNVVGDGECRQRSARDQQLLADFHDLDQLGRIRVEVDHVAGFLGSLGTGVHGYSHVGLRQRRRIVGAVAGHGHQPPAGLAVSDQRELGLRRGFREEVVHAGFGRDRGRRQLVVARDHHGADAHAAQLREALFDAAFDDVLQLDDAQHLGALGHDQRRGALSCDAVDGGRNLRQEAAARLLDP